MEAFKKIWAEKLYRRYFESLELDLLQGIHNKLVKNGEQDQPFMLQYIRVDVDQVDVTEVEQVCTDPESLAQPW